MNISEVSLAQISQPAKIANSGDPAFSGLNIEKATSHGGAAIKETPAISQGGNTTTNMVQASRKILGGKMDIAG